MEAPILALLGFGMGIPPWLCSSFVAGVQPDAVSGASSESGPVLAPSTEPVASTGAGAKSVDEDLDASSLHGSLGLGWRFLGVRGNHDQYREELNEEAGPLLREASLEGRSPKGASIERFALEARGLGDPDSFASGDIDAATLRARARWTRAAYRGNAQDDIHPFDFEQQRASLRVENRTEREDEVHAGLEATWHQRDGMSLGTRNIGFGFASGFPVHRREDAVGLAGDLRAPVAGFDVAIDGGIESLHTRTRDEFAVPSPADPTATETEKLGDDGRGTTQRFGLRAKRTMGSDLLVDFGARYVDADMDADLRSEETGILFSIDDPIERLRTADAHATAREFEADAGLRWTAAPGLALHARAREVRQSEHGMTFTHQAITESGVPFDVMTSEETSFEHNISAIEGGVDTALSEVADLDVSLAYGHDHETIDDRSNGTTVHAFDGGHDEYGGTARLSVEADKTCTLSIACGYELAPVETTADQSVVMFGRDEEAFAELRARWKPEAGVAVSGTLRHARRESTAFHSQADLDSISLAATFSGSPDWSADASWTMRIQENEADTTQLLLLPAPMQVPVTVRFAGVQNIVTAGLSKALNPRLRPRLSVDAAIANGDSAFESTFVSLDVPYRIHDGLTVGALVDLHRFDGEGGLDASDFSSTGLVVYATFAF
jgi:hypothetical protein